VNKYNTFARRFVAGIIDWFVLIPISYLDEFIIESDNIFLVSLVLSLIHCGFFIYSVLLHWSTGQTLGKKWMDVRVVDKSETTLLSLKQSLMRDCFYIITETIGLIVIINEVIEIGYYPTGEFEIEGYLMWFGLIWFLLEIVTMWSNDKRRALHDFLAGSVVVRDEFWKKQ
jgi:uncharacterized RDD family membrane protein YckC